MAGDPAPPIAEPRTFPRQDRSTSFGLRPLRRRDIIFALSSPIDFHVFEGSLSVNSELTPPGRSILRMANESSQRHVSARGAIPNRSGVSLVESVRSGGRHERRLSGKTYASRRVWPFVVVQSFQGDDASNLVEAAMVTSLSKLAVLIQEGSVPSWVKDQVASKREEIITALQTTGSYTLTGPNGETVEIGRSAVAAA